MKCGIIYNRKYNLHDMFVQNLDYTRYYNKNKHKNKNKNKIKNTVPNTSYFLGKNNVTPWPFVRLVTYLGCLRNHWQAWLYYIKFKNYYYSTIIGTKQA